MARVNLIYGREILIYTDLLKSYEELQENLNLDRSLWFKSYAKCYYTSMEPVKELLLFDNLKVKGYKLWDRKLPMNEEHVRFVLTEYGKFHAMSFALKYHRKDLYDRLAGKMNNLLIDNMDQMDATIKNMYDNTRKYFDPVTERDAIEYINRYENEGKQYTIESSKNPDDCIALIHGDCWTNNMLFKYEVNEREVSRWIALQLDFL